MPTAIPMIAPTSWPPPLRPAHAAPATPRTTGTRKKAAALSVSRQPRNELPFWSSLAEQPETRQLAHPIRVALSDLLMLVPAVAGSAVSAARRCAVLPRAGANEPPLKRGDSGESVAPKASQNGGIIRRFRATDKPTSA